MARFAEALDALKGLFPDAEEGTFDDISSAYDDDAAESRTGADAVVAELEAANAELSAQLVASQADNYRLMKSAAAPVDDAADDADSDDADEDYDSTADDFFTDDEEND